MQLIKFFKDLTKLFLKAPGFILEVWQEVMRKPELEEDEDFMGIHGEYLYKHKAPKDYHLYHHQDCGAKYRGCSDDCPKDRYEKTGVWKL